MSFAETPSQTIGPFFAVGLPWPDGPDVVPEGTPGAVRVGGRVLDGAGDPVPDALVETWQADPEGRFAHPDDPRGPAPGGFRGFGRCATDAQGRWAVRTVKPGPLPAPDANAADPLLASIPDEAARARLVANPDGDGLRFDIHLQGDQETPFLAL